MLEIYHSIQNFGVFFFIRPNKECNYDKELKSLAFKCPNIYPLFTSWGIILNYDDAIIFSKQHHDKIVNFAKLEVKLNEFNNHQIDSDACSERKITLKDTWSNIYKELNDDIKLYCKDLINLIQRVEEAQTQGLIEEVITLASELHFRTRYCTWKEHDTHELIYFLDTYASLVLAWAYFKDNKPNEAMKILERRYRFLDYWDYYILIIRNVKNFEFLFEYTENIIKYAPDCNEKKKFLLLALEVEYARTIKEHLASDLISEINIISNIYLCRLAAAVLHFDHTHPTANLVIGSLCLHHGLYEKTRECLELFFKYKVDEMRPNELHHATKIICEALFELKDNSWKIWLLKIAHLAFGKVFECFTELNQFVVENMRNVYGGLDQPLELFVSYLCAKHCIDTGVGATNKLGMCYDNAIRTSIKKNDIDGLYFLMRTSFECMNLPFGEHKYVNHKVRSLFMSYKYILQYAKDLSPDDQEKIARIFRVDYIMPRDFHRPHLDSVMNDYRSLLKTTKPFLSVLKERYVDVRRYARLFCKNEKFIPLSKDTVLILLSKLAPDGLETEAYVEANKFYKAFKA